MNKSLTQLPENRQPTTRIVARPTDTNAGGDIFGGWIMSQVDIAASIAAYRYAKGRVVTVAVNEFQFKKPVLVADLVSIYADVVDVGRTSMKIFVEVFAERQIRGVESCIKVTEASLTFVAIDDQRKPRGVPGLTATK